MLICFLASAFVVVPLFVLRDSSGTWLPFALFISIMGVAYAVTFFRAKKAFQKLMFPRSGENICTFRKAFAVRQVDPWIIRAVHEEVSGFIENGKTKVSIRASDRLLEDLQIDPMDLEDIAETIATRAGYDLADYQKNPFYEKLQTVGDLVMFFAHQRRIRP